MFFCAPANVIAGTIDPETCKLHWNGGSKSIALMLPAYLWNPATAEITRRLCNGGKRSKRDHENTRNCLWMCSNCQTAHHCRPQMCKCTLYGPIGTNIFGCKTFATIVYETHHGTHERWWSCCDNRFRAWEGKTNFDMENDHLGSGDDSIRVRPSCVAIREDPTVPHKPSCRGKLFSVRQRIGGAIGDCQTKNDNAVPQKFGWELFGVEASKSDVQLLSKALMNELWKIAEKLSKRCEYHGTSGSQKISGTNYSEGPSKRFNIWLHCFALWTDTEILKPNKLQHV